MERRKISGLMEKLVRPYFVRNALEAAYRDMARDEAREAEALDWAEATIEDAADESR